MYSIQRHLGYNEWADGKMVEILSGVDEKAFDTEVISSFPSLRKTVLHIWDAQTIWVTRLKGSSISEWPSTHFKGSVKEMLDGFHGTSKELAAFMSNKDKTFLETPIRYKNMKGIEFTQPVEDILFHVVNHGSYHRGQLITMLRQLGYDKFPALDLIAYLRLQ